MKIMLTTKALESLVLVKGLTKSYYFDSKQPGLCVIVNQGGKSFYFIRTHCKVGYRIRLGPCPGLGLTEARAAAAELMGRLARGERLKHTYNIITVGEVWQEYLKVCEIRQKSWRNTANYYRLYIAPYWNKYVISDITRVAVVGVDKFSQVTRDRHMTREEREKLFNADCSQDLKDFIKLAYFTGARKSNLLSMHWESISLELKSWQIESGESKNGSAMLLHLPGPALEILKRRRNNGSEFVFPSDSASGHLVSPGNGFRRLIKKLGIENLSIHDLRRSFASDLAISGASPLLIRDALGHKDLRSTQIYARLSFQAVRDAIDLSIFNDFGSQACPS